MTDDQLTAALDQLASQREQITRLDTREATHYATLTGLLAGLTARTGPADEDPGAYQPDPAPCWWQLSPEGRQHPARLRAWVDQVYRPGYGHLAPPSARAGPPMTCACTPWTSPLPCGRCCTCSPAATTYCCPPRPNTRPASCPPWPPSWPPRPPVAATPAPGARHDR